MDVQTNERERAEHEREVRGRVTSGPFDSVDPFDTIENIAPLRERAP